MSLRVSNLTRQIMKAIRVAKFGGEENLKLETNIPIPKPAEQEVLIKVMAAGVNPVDTYIRSGNYSNPPPLPYTPGQDCGGIVEEVGSQVSKFKKGDRVLTVKTLSGSYAEYATANEEFVSHLDSRLSYQQGASVGTPYYTAYKALHLRAQARPGETVLIHGASGAVGLAATQMGKAFGLRVLGTAGTKEGMDLVQRLGADAVFNHREDNYSKEIMAATGGKGVDIILEMLSNVNLQTDLTLLQFRGRIMVIGCRGPIEINPRLTMGKESSIMGVAIGVSTLDEWRVMHAALEAGQRLGWLLPEVAKSYSLSEASQAHHDVINNPGTKGKLIIDMLSA